MSTSQPTPSRPAHRLINRVREFRARRGWSQAELAARAGISRAAVSAIEGERLSPSVNAALALAAALGCTVEDLFGPGPSADAPPEWAWSLPGRSGRYWQAQVGPRRWLYPVETTPAGVVAHDGLARPDGLDPLDEADPRRTLVMACCDPAAGLLASEYARRSGFRMLVLSRSSGQALDLLRAGKVHVAGVHLAAADQSGGNAAAVRDRLGAGYRLVRLADWQEGLAISTGAGVRSVSSALRSRLSWVGREPGSGARQCLDDLLEGRRPPRRLARDHRAVAEAVRSGWADVGVCVRLPCEEAGLKFLPLRWEGYDLCLPTGQEDEPRMKALLDLVRDAAFRRLIGDLPGYDVRPAGESLVV
jgi:molybdate-binding protein/DNA-binding XRE family transcriptional regulator